MLHENFATAGSKTAFPLPQSPMLKRLSVQKLTATITKTLRYFVKLFSESPSLGSIFSYSYLERKCKEITCIYGKLF